MDGSAFRHLPIKGMVIFAAIGLGACAIGGITAVGAIVWFIAHHVSVY